MTIEQRNRDKIEEAIYLSEFISKIVPRSNFIIAGGSVRDLLNGKEINDIDFFVDANKSSIASKADITHDFYITLRRNLIDTTAIIKVISNSYSKHKALQVQLPVCKHDIVFVDGDPRDYVKKKFDIDFCKCWLNMDDYSFASTEEYLKDKNDKALTVNLNYHDSDQDEYPIGRSLLYHIPKILKKYPDFTPNIIHKEVK